MLAAAAALTPDEQARLLVQATSPLIYGLLSECHECELRPLQSRRRLLCLCSRPVEEASHVFPLIRGELNQLEDKPTYINHAAGQRDSLCLGAFNSRNVPLHAKEV